MIDKAIARINAEMQQHPSDKMLEAVGQYLIDLCTTEATAKALLDEKKTLAGAVAAMREAARKKASGGYYAMAPDEAWEIVRKYFGIAVADAAASRASRLDANFRAGTPRPEDSNAPRPPENGLPKGRAEEDGKIALDFDSFWG